MPMEAASLLVLIFGGIILFFVFLVFRAGQPLDYCPVLRGEGRAV